MRISDWSSDVCSSDLRRERHGAGCLQVAQAGAAGMASDAEASKLETPAPRRAAAGFGAVEQFSRLTGLDTRLLAMLAALLAIWIVLHLWTGGLFLTPRNLFNLAVQGSAVGIKIGRAPV